MLSALHDKLHHGYALLSFFLKSPTRLELDGLPERLKRADFHLTISPPLSHHQSANCGSKKSLTARQRQEHPINTAADNGNTDLAARNA